MKNTPLATVIIPSYNSPDFYATLNSVLEQDYPRIQLIIVDDASDSFSENEVLRYLHKANSGNIESVHVLVNEQNRGTVYTMNRALQNTHGDFIFNLASDDCFYDSQVLSDWVAEFIRTGAKVITAYRAVYDEKLITCREILPTQEQVEKIRTASPDDLFEEIAKVNFIFGCCTARSASCIQTYGFHDERYRLIDDHPMILKMLRQGEVISFFDRVVVKYRGGGTSSPVRYNEVYARDVDEVLTHDVLPYTRHPVRMRRHFRRWKREQRFLKKYVSLMNRYADRSCFRLMLMAWYVLHDPIRILRKLPVFIQKFKKSDCFASKHSKEDHL